MACVLLAARDAVPERVTVGIDYHDLVGALSRLGSSRGGEHGPLAIAQPRRAVPAPTRHARELGASVQVGDGFRRTKGRRR